jgi:threonine aldolase
MQTWNFMNDYSEGCHPAILKALAEANDGQQTGYGDDEYCARAREVIRRLADNSDADVYFVSGGTQANLIVIAAALRPHESVIAASSGHIHVHEAGAVEATGHKINVVEHPEGKVTIDAVQAVLDEHIIIPHMVKPAMVYISNSTEVGTVYSRAELTELSRYCKQRNLLLFCDGARLGAALASAGSDLQIRDFAELTDVFYIGGTKNGAMWGEAIVIVNDRLKSDFGFYMKQHGALLSKGRFLGIQFLELFRNNLFFELSRHANTLAMNIASAVREHGFSFLTSPITNQIFPVFPNPIVEQLNQKYAFYIWKKIDSGRSAVRLVTSWATPKTVVDSFIRDLNHFVNL